MSSARPPSFPPRSPSIPPVVSFVGRSGSGKTQFLERLIPVLKKRGHSVGIVKHHAHEIEVDQPGKDTHRFFLAGADRVSLSGPTRNAYFESIGDFFDFRLFIKGVSDKNDT